jgi:large conductance mechanosensitive channel
MGLIKEFKDFIAKGNVLDLAVGVIIGAAFGKIIDSLVADVITPAVLKPVLEKANVDKLENLSAGGILYGKFIAATISFLVIAFVVFLIVKGFNAMKKKEAEAPAAPSSTDVLLSEIRDELRKK